MRTKILDSNEFIRRHLSKPVTSPALYVRNEINEEGLLSESIFGVTPDEKRVMSGFIKLNKKYVSPLIYNGYFKRRWRDIDDVISGTKKFYITDNGELQSELDMTSDKGDTGIDWFYNNFDKLKLRGAEIKEDDRVLTSALKSSFNKLDKSKAFMDTIIVIPLVFRDVKNIGGSVVVDELTGLYQRLISLNNMVATAESNPIVNRYRLDFNIQLTLNMIFAYFKDRVFGKAGLQRKGVMGKPIDYAGRAVISAPSFTGHFGSSPIDLDTAGYPLSMVISTHVLQMGYWLSNQLREYYEKGYFGDITVSEFEAEFTYKKINKMLNLYIDSFGDRIRKIPIPNRPGEFLKIPMTIDYTGSKTSVVRDITLTELLYMIAYQKVEVKGLFQVLSRYPINDEQNIIITKEHVLSTIDTIKVEIDGLQYPYYPDLLDKTYDDIFTTGKTHIIDISVIFHETIKISNTYLKGLDGDYDGDKVAIRAPMSNDAIEECKMLIEQPTNIFTLDGRLVRFVGGEAVQALYSLSVPADEKSVVVDAETVQKLVNAKPEDLSPTFIFKDLKMGKMTNRKTGYRHNDIVNIKRKDGMRTGEEFTQTTLGRLLINKVILNQFGVPYVNDTFTSKKIEAVFYQIRDMYFAKELTLDQVKHSIKIYEDFGFRMSSFINPSLDPNVSIPSAAFRAKKQELLDKYKTELENNDVQVAAKIEDELIDYAKKEYKGNPYMDWYESGASGKMGYKNDFKIAQIMVGAVPKAGAAGEFVVSTSTYVDGTKKHELNIFAEQMIVASYMRAKNTAVGGYLTKQAQSIYQSLRMNKHGSDCGTHNGVYKKVTEKNVNDIIDSYTTDGLLITKENVGRYIGKFIKLRSPITCEDPMFCSKCIGEMLYRVMSIFDRPVNIGLRTTKILSELTQKSLQKTHVMGAALMDIGEMDDWLIKH